MGKTGHVTLRASRILDDADRTGLASNDSHAQMGPGKFILATQVAAAASTEPIAAQFKLRWRVSGGTFADVGSTGAIKFAQESAVLVNDATLTQANSRCGTLSGYSWSDGLESVGDNELPSGSTFAPGTDEYTEFQWALDCSDADLFQEFELELWNITNNTSAGVCGATVEAINYPPSVQLHTSDQTEFSTGRPSFEFTGTDPEGDDITYNLQINAAQAHVYVITQSHFCRCDKSTFEPVECELRPANGFSWHDEAHVVQDDTHFYIHGHSLSTSIHNHFVSKISKSDLSIIGSEHKITNRSTRCIGIKGDYVYVGKINWLYKYNKSDLALVDEIHYWEEQFDPAELNAICFDDDHIYFGGAPHVGLWKVAINNFSGPITKKHNLDNIIRRMIGDGEYLYYVSSGMADFKGILHKHAMSDLSHISNVTTPINGSGWDNAKHMFVDPDGPYLYCVSGRYIMKYNRDTLEEAATPIDWVDDTQFSSAYMDSQYLYANNGTKFFIVDREAFTIIETLEPTFPDDFTRQFVVEDVAVLRDLFSSQDPGFENVDTPGDTDPFQSGDRIKYTVPEEDTLDAEDYSWRVRGKDV